MNLETAQEVIENWGSPKEALKFLRSCVILTENTVKQHNHNLKLIDEIVRLILKEKAKDVWSIDQEQLYNDATESTKIKSVDEFFERMHNEIMRDLENIAEKENLKQSGVDIGSDECKEKEDDCNRIENDVRGKRKLKKDLEIKDRVDFIKKTLESNRIVYKIDYSNEYNDYVFSIFFRDGEERKYTSDVSIETINKCIAFYKDQKSSEKQIEEMIEEHERKQDQEEIKKINETKIFFETDKPKTENYKKFIKTCKKLKKHEINFNGKYDEDNDTYQITVRIRK